MSNYLESQILNKFIDVLKMDKIIPNELVNDISKLNEEGKILKGNNLKKLLEDFSPSEGDNNEDKKN
jgi:hypothetical protein